MEARYILGHPFNGYRTVIPVEIIKESPKRITVRRLSSKGESDEGGRIHYLKPQDGTLFVSRTDALKASATHMETHIEALKAQLAGAEKGLARIKGELT